MKIKDNPYFCEHMWTHLYKHTDDNVKLCCIDEGDSLGSLKTKSIDEIRNGKEYKKIRRDVLSGKKLDRCYRCYEAEERGWDSYRLKGHETNLSNFTEEAKPIKFLDYRADNVCNLACKSCGGAYSTKLIDADLKLGNISEDEAKKLRFVNKDNKNISEIFDKITDVDNIYFAGGEPLLNQQHWDILDHLKKLSKLENTSLNYSTNLTVLDFKKYSVDEYWPYPKNLTIQASIDGMGDSFEYFRTGAKWNNVLKNFERVNKIRKNSLHITSTFNWMNLNSVFSLCKFLLENKIISDFEKFDFNFMYGATGGVQYTPIFAKDELLSDIEDFKKYAITVKGMYVKSNFYKKLDAIKNSIINSNPVDDDLRNWVMKLKIIDNQYKTNINSILTFKDDRINKKILETYNSIES